MNHEESRLQQQCVAWFRAQYPQYAMLLTHPINEGYKNTRVSGAIHKAEGTVAGVSDLLLFLPAVFEMPVMGLGIEFKTEKGTQSQQQKDFQKMFVAAGYEYVVVRSFEEFKSVITDWIAHVIIARKRVVKEIYNEIVKEQEERERKRFYKIIGKK